MKFVLSVVICLTFIRPDSAFSQLYSTRAGFIGIYSKTVAEDIDGENNQVYAVIDAGKKNLAFAALIKGFVFHKELMQEHFNENYMESDKYPKATFSGAYTGDVALDKDGVYKVTVKGNLTLHNTTKPIETPATLEVKSGHVIGVADFKIKPEDYNVSIPSVVRDKIDKEMTIKVNINCTTK